ncbi:putative Microspore-specific promoter 2 [Melia azedarach]|uniref:Microspore-specific promoter 2 n=1 Tax=Melia azedarach TaxID=155640 RepID=A0ACC1YZZ0_MELAZ|nr:putative Microspore-specific promoter 2 [Melia azedarach]
MENDKHAHHSMPLVSRLDHLESIMKNLESKRNTGKWGSSTQAVERQYLPLNLAVREAYFKGSLLDRVASLENRLFQLCLELESSSTSCTSSGDASSSLQGSKQEVACSLPTFFNHNPKQEPQVQANLSEIQGKHSKVIQQRGKQVGCPIKEKGKSKGNRDDKRSKSEKKRASSNWPHLKMLGC